MSDKPSVCIQYRGPRAKTVDEFLNGAQRSKFVPAGEIRVCPKADCGFFTRDPQRKICPHCCNTLVDEDEFGTGRE